MWQIVSCKLKKRVSGLGSSTPCLVTVIDNTTYTTQALLELSLKPLFFECRNKNSYHQITPLSGYGCFYFIIYIVNLYDFQMATY